MSSSDHEAVSAKVLEAVRAYAAAWEDGERFDPISLERDGLTKTEVAILASALLRSADIATFELTMWQTWQA